MNKCVMYVLMAMLPLASWANTAAPCVKEAETQVTQQHAHHDGAAGNIEEAGDQYAGGDFEAPSACPFCESCITMCAVSGGGSGAIDAVVTPVSHKGDSQSPNYSGSFHIGPPRHPLFRPPIQLI